MLIRRTAVVAALLGALAIPVWAQPTFEGFLCCNLRTDGSWASDSNYAESGKRIIPVGTPVRVTGYGRYRVRYIPSNYCPWPANTACCRKRCCALAVSTACSPL